MTSLSTFYYTIDLLLLVYACYSWYWQASIQVRGRYRLSSIIWAIIFLNSPKTSVKYSHKPNLKSYSPSFRRRGLNLGADANKTFTWSAKKSQ